MMKSGAILLVIAGLLISTGCSAAIWGNLAVLVISIAIFFCTLSLGIPAARQTLSGMSRSESPQPEAAGGGEVDRGGVTAGRARTRG
jgi:hypothetical protein